ncbi:MAG: disulfide bond formation protein B [Gallionellaceae bacterium]|jgi:disulfide bond formation protein DsbB|nr:disulfide bond formation protein B [Gallionellaceae bacterium]
MNTSRLCTPRALYLIAALGIAAVLGAALYLQYVEHQEPCPLCMVQRLVFEVMLALFLIAGLHNPRRTGAKIYSGLIVLVAIGGMAVAGRHIWIQNLPKDEVPACGPGLDYMLESFPLSEVLKELMHGSGECAAKGWTFLSLTLPQLSMIGYVLLAVWAVLVAVRARRMA